MLTNTHSPPDNRCGVAVKSPKEVSRFSYQKTLSVAECATEVSSNDVYMQTASALSGRYDTATTSFLAKLSILAK